MKLSIIVPAYNVEQYIVKCLQSCQRQNVDKSEYEIVVINDGSKDNTQAIIDAFEWNGCNHEMIVQENQGLSMARNNGIKVACGDYVWFVDSDDWIEENCLSDLFKYLNGVDVVCQRAIFINYPEREVIEEKFGDYIKGRDFLNHPYQVMAPLFIYRRSFLLDNSFFFKPGIYHEDTQFTPRVVYCANSIACYFKPLYHYLQREGTITSAFNPKKIYDLMSIYDDLYDFYIKTVLNDDKKGWSRYLMSGPILEMLWLSKQTDDKKIREDVISFVNLRPEMIDFLKNSCKKEIKVLGYIAKICGYKLIPVYDLFYKLRY